MEEAAQCQHSVSILLATTDRQQGLAQRTYVMYSGLSQALYSLKSSSQVALFRDVTNEYVYKVKQHTSRHRILLGHFQTTSPSYTAPEKPFV
jgi:hypothetical protein